MGLNSLKKNVKKTYRKAGFNEVPVVRILESLHKQVHFLIKERLKEKVVDKSLINVQLLILQLAGRYNTNLDNEWKKYWKEFKSKYMNKKPTKDELKAKIKLFR